MPLRFASLGSGSRGNALLVEAGTTSVMVDCGFSCAETERRLARLKREPASISAVVVTHEHGDHMQGVAALARKYALPVWLTPGTFRAWSAATIPDVRLFSCHDPFSIGDLCIRPFPVPHDAREPCQFVFDSGAQRLGLLTDTGSITPHTVEMLDGLDALMLESNHDAEMLAAGPYPASLKRRVGGSYGHLSNSQAAELLRRVDTSRLQHLVAAHLSEQNNCPQRVRQVLGDALNCASDWIAIADQDAGLSWRQVV